MYVYVGVIVLAMINVWYMKQAMTLLQINFATQNHHDACGYACISYAPPLNPPIIKFQVCRCIV